MARCGRHPREGTKGALISRPTGDQGSRCVKRLLTQHERFPEAVHRTAPSSEQLTGSPDGIMKGDELANRCVCVGWPEPRGQLVAMTGRPDRPVER